MYTNFLWLSVKSLVFFADPRSSRQSKNPLIAAPYLTYSASPVCTRSVTSYTNANLLLTGFLEQTAMILMCHCTAFRSMSFTCASLCSSIFFYRLQRCLNLHLWLTKYAAWSSCSFRRDQRGWCQPQSWGQCSCIIYWWHFVAPKYEHLQWLLVGWQVLQIHMHYCSQLCTCHTQQHTFGPGVWKGAYKHNCQQPWITITGT